MLELQKNLIRVIFYSSIPIYLLAFLFLLGLGIGYLICQSWGILPVWVEVLLLFGISGAFGGILASMQLADLPELVRSPQVDHWSRQRLANTCIALVISAFGGIGGAVSALFVMLLDGKIKPTVDDLARLSYVTAGVLAGFIGFQLLKKVAEGFAQALSAAKDVAKEEATKVAEDLVQKERMQRELAEAITDSFLLIGRLTMPDESHRPNPETIQNAIDRHEAARRPFLDHRRAAIVLARLYRHGKNDLRTGKKILEETARAMRRAETTPKDDEAAVLFNRACYASLLFTTATGAEKDQFKEEAFSALEEAIRLIPSNAKQARTDADLEGLKTERVRFEAVTATN